MINRWNNYRDRRSRRDNEEEKEKKNKKQQRTGTMQPFRSVRGFRGLSYRWSGRGTKSTIFSYSLPPPSLPVQQRRNFYLYELERKPRVFSFAHRLKKANTRDSEHALAGRGIAASRGESRRVGSSRVESGRVESSRVATRESTIINFRNFSAKYASRVHRRNLWTSCTKCHRALRPEGGDPPRARFDLHSRALMRTRAP